MPKVYSKRSGHTYPVSAVLVDRTTPFGNPFHLHHEQDRDIVIANYRSWLMEPEQADLRAKMREELRGKDLLCWCAPKPCHADVIMEVANADG